MATYLFEVVSVEKSTETTTINEPVLIRTKILLSITDIIKSEPESYCGNSTICGMDVTKTNVFKP